MADASSDWADRPGSDLALSSDEEDFVSSQSTASVEHDALSKLHLASALGNLHLDKADSSQNSEQCTTRTQASTPGTGGSIYTASNEKSERKPLQLLDLPLDILKEIVKEVTHTNDLTSLALTCSSLHGLTIPHMYSRFDIVWPESLNPTADDYTGVDALSYGLSTLVMGEDVFHKLPLLVFDQNSRSCSHCGCNNRGLHPAMPSQTTGMSLQPRRGNSYAQYTRTFSIGNGPLSWVQEYSVNREVGKMLGTLVALAVARMINLEAFIWDMPTGVVREIWLALASLADRPDHRCRLERIWVRWHDNSENVLRVSVAPAISSSRLLQKYKHVEHPSLSVLPPLKSIAVLDIDEPAYVEELAVLIERSRHRLVELRIGIALKAYLSNWLICAKESDTPIDSPSSWPRVGGVLSILSKCAPEVPQEDPVPLSSATNSSIPSEPSTDTASGDNATKVKDTETGEEASSLLKIDQRPLENNKDNIVIPPARFNQPASKPCPSVYGIPSFDKLSLEVLELERVPLSVPNLLPTLDWTRLTTLTLMRCEDHEHLWRALRRKYAPPPTPHRRPQQGERRRSSLTTADYSLNLKHLRTNTVSPYLMHFIKDALAPNTLESVYLHEAPAHDSTVQIDAIHKYILRKHRLSLRKVLIDASERHGSADNLGTRWHKWMFNHEMISFVTSGRMPQLRELGMAMHYRDWHYFLQRLPNMPQLRALYLPHISHSVHRDLRELALQVLDIVSIRPELRITYLGLQTKCYQILEGDPNGSDSEFDENQSVGQALQNGDDGLSAFDEEPLELSEEDDGPLEAVFNDPDPLSSDLSDDYETEPDENSTLRLHFRLQEILFYDDKISIFKARHGVI
ncbi:uncharacterized protein N7459_005289 [Penicillium hispanicum]|uniref:uncharacterized protein n=1 Tax=Penicillium hispanicum TaxID=1080232 RepID=UPI0025426460|nr:uncharacterized protein N7459_005289 [Penicillium hispanicum]KAJ5585489.1 hypothetical protein N7459_005289 [Penicillium hispanicum]